MVFAQIKPHAVYYSRKSLPILSVSH